MVRSSIRAEYHKDAAKPLLSTLMENQWKGINVLGGGRIGKKAPPKFVMKRRITNQDFTNQLIYFIS